ncbi:MAG: hypothetical protein M3361_15505, partial [Candidatus Tectomicrobia bacterium]|nr:hypothetical protein [Candidatus Tectomicrobia bacterium]
MIRSPSGPDEFAAGDGNDDGHAAELNRWAALNQLILFGHQTSMELKIIIHTADSYESWRERLADKSLANANTEEIERFWDKFYQDEFGEQFSVEVSPDTKVYELKKELIEKYKASNLNKGSVKFKRKTGQKYIFRSWDYE